MQRIFYLRTKFAIFCTLFAKKVVFDCSFWEKCNILRIGMFIIRRYGRKDMFKNNKKTSMEKPEINNEVLIGEEKGKKIKEKKVKEKQPKVKKEKPPKEKAVKEKKPKEAKEKQNPIADLLKKVVKKKEAQERRERYEF